MIHEDLREGDGADLAIVGPNNENSLVLGLSRRGQSFSSTVIFMALRGFSTMSQHTGSKNKNGSHCEAVTENRLIVK